MCDLALRAAGGDPVLNLALEESLLERGLGNKSALLLYVNDPCVVIGRNQNPWVEVSPRARAPVLRRVSGGGAVYQDRGNLNWSIVAPRADHDREAELALVCAALRGLGVEAEPGPRGGLFAAGEGPLKGAKISGTARRITAARVVHHGTLLVDTDLDALSASLGGIEARSSRALPSISSRIANLSSMLPGLGVEDVAAALVRGLCGDGVEEAEKLADRASAEAAAARLSSWDWTWGATPAFDLALGWSGGIASVEIRRGAVASVSGAGAESLRGLVGARFDYGLPATGIDILEGRAEPSDWRE